MSDERGREYYIHRKGRKRVVSFSQLKKLFNGILEYLDKNDYLWQAMTLWGPDIPAFFLKEIQMEEIWPFERYLPKYNETTLFSVMEVIHDYVSKPVTKGRRRIMHDFDNEEGQSYYRSKINEMLSLYWYTIRDTDGIETLKAFEMSADGRIHEKIKEGFEDLPAKMHSTSDPESIDDKIRYAVSQFTRYGAKLEERKDAVRTLGDVLEFLKKKGIKMPKADDRDLFKILNKFSIRHHEPTQKGDYTHEVWYEFAFYLFLASINVLLRFKKSNED